MTVTAHRATPRVAAVVGMILFVAVAVFPYGASGLLAPVWGIAVLYAGWAGMLVGAVALWRRRPGWVLVMPVAALAWWWAVLSAGEAWFGWVG